MELYYCRIDELDELQGAKLLTQERRSRMERYMKRVDRARCLAAGLLLRAALGESAAQITQGEHGKPYLPQGPHFNLSHSGDYVILGISEGEIGVDIELIAPFDDRVARRCYTGPELSWLCAERGDAAFYKLWTAKESVMKATGRGFAMSPGSFSVLPVADGRHVIDGRAWYLKWLCLPGYQICTACAADGPVRLVPLDAARLMSIDASR